MKEWRESVIQERKKMGGSGVTDEEKLQKERGEEDEREKRKTNERRMEDDKERVRIKERGIMEIERE